MNDYKLRTELTISCIQFIFYIPLSTREGCDGN